MEKTIQPVGGQSSDRGEVKLPFLTEQEKNELITYCGVVAGCRPPGQPELIVLRTWMADKHPNFTANNVKRAFDLWAVGTLQVRFEHYGAFSPKFFSVICKAYEPMTISPLTNPERLIPQKIEEKPFDALKVLEGMINWNKLNGRIPLGGPWTEMRNALEENGSLKGIDLNSFKEKASELIDNECIKTRSVVRGMTKSDYYKQYGDKKSHYRKQSELIVKHYINLKINEK